MHVKRRKTIKTLKKIGADYINVNLLVVTLHKNHLQHYDWKTLSEGYYYHYYFSQQYVNLQRSQNKSFFKGTHIQK